MEHISKKSDAMVNLSKIKDKEVPKEVPKVGGHVLKVIGVIVVILLLWMFIVRIPPGYVGVYYGAINGIDLENVREPGWHFKVPFFQSVYKIKTARDTISMFGTEESCFNDPECTDVALQVPTKEGLLVTLDLTVLYKTIPEQAPRIVQELTDEYSIKTLVPKIRSAAREATGTLLITELYGPGREALQNQMFNLLKDDLQRDGFILEDVLVRDVDLPEQIRNAIEDKQTAEQRSFQKQFEIDLAQKEATRLKVQGEGIANQKIAIAEGDAQALAKIAQILATNPRVLDFKRLEVLAQLYNNPNTKFVALPSGNLILPTDLGVGTGNPS